MVAKDYRGKVFIQIAPRLRWINGKAGETDSFRPIDDLTGNVVGDPPLITFADDADADVERWLMQGRIQLAPDQTAKAAAPLSDAEAHAKQKKPDATEPGGA